MPGTEQRIEVAAPPAKVFAYVADFARHPEWGRHITKLEPTSEGPVGLGATYRSSARLFGNHEATIRVSKYDPDTLLAFDVQDDTGEYHHEFRLSPSAVGTSLTKSISMVRPSNLMSRVFALVVFPLLGPKGIRNDLALIKERVEAGS